MLLPRIPRLALRGKATRRVCASCLALQSAAFATRSVPSLPQQQQQQPSGTPSSETPTAASVSAPPYQPKRPKRGRTPSPPQPGPPNPPWPDPNPEAGPQRRKGYTYEKGLIENAITLAQLAYPHKFPFSPPAKGKMPAAAPIFTIAVPRPPDFRNDYTNMGPDVVAPWRKGGAFKPVADREIKAAGGGASSYGQRYSKNYGVRVRYSTHHALHPWSANHMAASPGIEDAHGASDGQGTGAASSGWPVGFPHSFTEMVRRKYAIKSHTDSLWWFATVFTTTDGELPNSNLVRNKMRYKLQSALQAALKQRGYAENGHRLEGKAGAPAKYNQLYGSMRVDGPLGQMLTAPYDDLVGFLAKAVIVVEGLLGGREQRKPDQMRGGNTGSGTGTGQTTGAAKMNAKPRQDDGPSKKGKGTKGNKDKDRFSMLLDPSLF